MMVHYTDRINWEGSRDLVPSIDARPHDNYPLSNAPVNIP